MTRKTAFFEELSWFKFNNLRLTLGKKLKFYTSLSKGLKLKVRKFWVLILTFLKVTGEKLVGGPFCPPPILNRVEDKKCVTKLMNIFDTLSKFSWLKSNESKFEIAGIGALKEVQVALCGMRCIDLVSNIVKILGIYCSYYDKLEFQENFKRHVIKIEKILQIWRMTDLSIAGKIAVFKTLAISKIVHLALVKIIPN